MYDGGSDRIVFFTFIVSGFTLLVLLCLLLMPVLPWGEHITPMQGLRLASVGVLGVLSGTCVMLSNFWGHGRTLGALGLALCLAYMVPIAYMYIGIGHLYGPSAVALMILSIWNLVRQMRRS